MNTPLKYVSVLTVSKLGYPDNTFVLCDGEVFSLSELSLDLSRFDIIFLNDPWYFSESYFELICYREKMLDLSMLLTALTGVKIEHAHKNSSMSFVSILYTYLSKHEGSETPSLTEIESTSEGIKKELRYIGKLIDACVSNILKDVNGMKILNRILTIEMPLVHYYLSIEKKGLRLNVPCISNLINEIDIIAFSLKYSDVYQLEVHGHEKHELSSLSKQKMSLLKVLSGDGIVHPLFDTWGTVSSRIMIREPYLQFINSSYRNSVYKTLGNRLIYPDYISFEPAIIAGEVKGRFLDAFNNGQLYELISDYIFLSSDYRKEAKKFFLSLIYGMNQAALIRDIASKASVSEGEMSVRVSLLKSDFKDLFLWLDQVRSESFLNRVVGELALNPRCTTGDSNTWIVSHYVQSIASLVFKEVLLALIDNNIQPLIPMHDGVVCDLPDGVSVQDVEKIFIETFQSRYPDVRIKVKIDEVV